MGKRKPTQESQTPKKLGADEKYTPQQMIEALRATKGMITLAARRVGCDYNTIRRYIDLYPEVKEALEMERNALDDLVEMKLYNRIDKDDTAAIIFYAKTKLRHRGYVERQEVTGADGGGIRVEIAYVPLVKRDDANDQT